MSAQVKVIAHSIAEHKHTVATLAVRYWRGIHAEVLTHRDFSRNASSSRAIPVMRMLKQVWNEPAGPIHWGANRPGMQATEQLTGWRLWAAKALWKSAARCAAAHSWAMGKIGLHKQVANRTTEPYQYINVLITSTQWDNFFALRLHSDAQPEIQELAREMKMALTTSTPRLLRKGEWHLPYVSDRELLTYGVEDALRMSTARCARVSFLNHDMTDPVPAKDYKLHDDLVGADPIHASPTEHAVQAMENADRYANFCGFRSYRRCVESGSIIIHGQVRPLAFHRG